MRHILIISILLINGWYATAQNWHTKVGQQVPYFEIETKDGTKKSTETLEGKVVLINFFATWCPPCRQELPEVQKQIWDKHKDREDFEIVVLAREEGWDKLTPFVEQFGYTFPFYPDLNRKIYSLFAPDTIPRNVIIDRNGKIIYQSIGYEPEEFAQMADLIQLHLDQPY